MAGLPVNRILIVNPMNFFWKEGMTAESLQKSVDVARDLSFYRERLLSATIWKRILTGDLRTGRLVRICVHRPVLAVGSAVRDLARRIRIPLLNDLGRELEQIAARGFAWCSCFRAASPESTF